MSTSKKLGAFADVAGWSATAREYKELNRSGLTGPIITSVVSTANALRPFSTASAVLDDGCGTGQVTEHLITNYGRDLPSGARLIAGDFAEGMVEQVELTKRELQATQPEWERVEARVLDATELGGVEDGSLSHVLSNLCLFGIADADKGLQQAHRVLGKGGVIAVSGITAAPWLDIMGDATKIRSETSLAQAFRVNEGWKSAEALKKTLEGHGFQDVRTEAIDVPMVLPNPRMFLEKFIRSSNPAVTHLFGGWSEDELKQAVDLSVEQVRREHGAGAVTLHGKAVTGGGRK